MRVCDAETGLFDYSMRGRSTTWTRIRINLEHVPEKERPPQEPLEVDYDPWAGVEWPGKR